MTTILLAVIIGCILLFFSILAVASILSLFAVGIMGGWIAKEEFYNMRYSNMHPEFFDENGNLIPDKIIAFQFPDEDNNDTDTTEDSEEEY